MLAFTWIALRFIHFTSLMLVFGFAMYGAWLAPLTIRRLLAKRFLRLQPVSYTHLTLPTIA